MTVNTTVWCKQAARLCYQIYNHILHLLRNREFWQVQTPFRRHPKFLWSFKVVA